MERRLPSRLLRVEMMQRSLGGRRPREKEATRRPRPSIVTPWWEGWHMWGRGETVGENPWFVRGGLTPGLSVVFSVRGGFGTCSSSDFLSCEGARYLVFVRFFRAMESLRGRWEEECKKPEEGGRRQKNHETKTIKSSTRCRDLKEPSGQLDKPPTKKLFKK